MPKFEFPGEVTRVERRHEWVKGYSEPPEAVDYSTVNFAVTGSNIGGSLTIKGLFPIGTKVIVSATVETPNVSE